MINDGVDYKKPCVGTLYEWNGVYTQAERHKLLTAAITNALQELTDEDARNIDEYTDRLQLLIKNVGAVSALELLAKLGMFLNLAEKEGYDV